MLHLNTIRQAVPCSLLLVAIGVAFLGCGSDAKGASANTAGTGGTSGTTSSAGAANATGGSTTGGGSTLAFCNSVLTEGVAGVTVTDARLFSATAAHSAYCLIGGSLDGSLNFRVALPENWNRKLLFLGGGGFDGEIPDVNMSPDALGAGYAIVANDSGHQGMGPVPGFDGSWALDDAKALEAFGWTSTHSVLKPATALIEARYGRPIEKQYFEGCSNGGREALIAAQRWPNDFDGIIARAPAHNFTGAMTAFHRNAALVDALGGTLTLAKLTTVANAELSACDADDGVSDGIITRPEVCNFDSATLRCKGASNDTCLSDLELATLTGIRAETPLPYQQVDGLVASPAWLVGHEADTGWSGWMLGDEAPSVQFLLQDQFLKYFVTKNSGENTLTTALDAYAPVLNELSSLLDATNPDLSEFAQHGGKLILWHGLSDAALSPQATAEYYEQAVALAGGQAKADEFLRYFPAAGVYHCLGGPGADRADLLTALDKWVTAGAPPENLIAVHAASASNAVSFTRPLCAYPSYPRYSGTGDPNAAASYDCSRE